MSEEILKVLEKLKNKSNYQRDCNDGSYFIELFANEIYILCKFMEDLQQKVEQLENIRKEAIDYIENTDFDSEDNIVAKKAKDGIIGAFILENKIPKDLLNILNKGE